MTDLEKAKILYESQIRMFGNGHFDLTVDDAAQVLRLLKTKRTPDALKKSLREFYESHPDKKQIDESFKESYLQY